MGVGFGGTLLLWGLERYDPCRRTVSGIQQYELYDQAGVMRSKEFLTIQFVLHERSGFEPLAQAAGFRAIAVFGDYDRADFQEESSLFMIWILEKQG